jgi:hypothetical protein
MCLFATMIPGVFSVSGEGGIKFNGLEHCPLGDAKLSLTEEGLLVENIGESGKDGVSILPGQAQGLITTTNGLDPKTLPEGANLTSTAVGQVNGMPNTPIAAVIVNIRQERIWYGCKGFVPATGATGEVWRNGRVIATVENLEGDFVSIPVPTRCDRTDPACPVPTDCLIRQDVWFEEPLPIDIVSTGKTVIGDAISIRIASDVRIDNLQNVNITSSGMGSFTVQKNEVVINNLTHTSVGEAKVTAKSGNLVVSDFGDDAQKGVKIDLKDTRYYEMNIQPLCLDRDGEALYLDSHGTVDGVADTFMGTASMVNELGALGVSADYSPLGTSEVTVRLLREGRFVAEKQMPAGEVVSIPNPKRFAGSKNWGQNRSAACNILPFEAATDMIVDGETFSADTIILLAPEMVSDVSSLDAVTVRATGIDSLVIQKETDLYPRRQYNFKR